MAAPEGMKCPFNCFDPCVKDACAMYVRINGTDPNTGVQVNKGACALAWQPTIQIEGNQMAREQGAAIESLRNRIEETNQMTSQVVLGVRDLMQTLSDAAQRQQIKGE